MNPVLKIFLSMSVSGSLLIHIYVSFPFSHAAHRPFLLPLYIEAMEYSNVPYLVAGKPIKQAIELGTIAFQISTIFSSFFREISRKGILISKLGKNPANH